MDIPQKLPLWPESLLAPKIPNARILAFNHDKMTIDTFWNERDQISRKSSRLTKDLVDVRGAKKDQRPIIFVAHCLGGLVVQDDIILVHGQALMRASRDEYECKIADMTVGLILLGTPNYNDDSLLKEAKKYYQLANVDIPSDPKLKALSTRILEIPRAFQTFKKSRSLRVNIFYADRPVSINGEDVYIVEESVVKIQGNGDPDALNEDHHEMARFDSENEDFVDLLRPIRTMTDEIINKKQKNEGGTNIHFSGNNNGLQVGVNDGQMNGYSFGQPRPE